MGTRKRRKKVEPSTGEAPKDVTIEECDDPGFAVRDGDRLMVQYAGAKISLEGTYSSVEIDGATFSRTLREGDDAGEEFEKIYTFVKTRSEAHARTKLAWFVGQIRSANERARGNS